MIIVFTTAPNAEEAENLARKIVEARLAACVQVLPPMKSFYFWENAVQTDSAFARQNAAGKIFRAGRIYQNQPQLQRPGNSRRRSGENFGKLSRLDEGIFDSEK
jgi:hypothetical protein